MRVQIRNPLLPVVARAAELGRAPGSLIRTSGSGTVSASPTSGTEATVADENGYSLWLFQLGTDTLGGARARLRVAGEPPHFDF